MVKDAAALAVPVCCWCGSRNPGHVGGFQRRDGTKVTGLFCKKGCYDSWELAHAMIEVR